MSHVKEYDETPKKGLNKMETNNLCDTQFKSQIVRMLKELSEDLDSTERKQSEMRDTLIEMKNNLQGVNNKIDEVKNQISDLEYKEAKNTQLKQHEEKRIQKN